MVETEVIYNSPQWKRLVKQVRETHAESVWVIGDILLKVAPKSQAGICNGSDDVMRVFALEAGISFQTARQYRRLASIYTGVSRKSTNGLTVYRALVPHPDRLKLVRKKMTIAEAHALVTEYNAESGVPVKVSGVLTVQLTPEQFTHVNTCADDMGISKSEYIRGLIEKDLSNYS